MKPGYIKGGVVVPVDDVSSQLALLPILSFPLMALMFLTLLPLALDVLALEVSTLGT